MNSIKGKILFFLLLAGFCVEGFAQSLDQAKKLFNEERFGEAKPVFAKLVNQTPTNASYNLWYGVCCYETGDFAAAEKYLLVASKRKMPESYHYLAKLYTTSYRFTEAIDQWGSYIEHLETKRENTERFEAQLQLTEKMVRMKEKTEDVQIIDSLVVEKSQLLSAYFLSEDCGRLEWSDRLFASSGSLNVPSVVYVNPKDDQAYYGRSLANGQCAVYTQYKLLDNWGDEKRLLPGDSSNTNYPFVLGDGVTLYFASQGHGSIGGYDLFVTRYNSNQNTYLAPEQLGMPFNSPANDYLLVVDEAKGVGWFVSDRNQPAGKVCIYLFIPDESRKRLPESDDKEWIRKRAALLAIKDTWKPSTNYSDIIRLARTNTASQQVLVKRDFDFVVNDQLTYYYWNDFKSTEAKGFYEKALHLQDQLTVLQGQLTANRQAYGQANQSARSQMEASMIELEKKANALYPQIDEWEKRARNAENVFIKR